jgi:hypothetical protein
MALSRIAAPTTSNGGVAMTTVYNLSDIILTAFIAGVTMALDGEVTMSDLHDPETAVRVLQGFVEETHLQPGALEQIIGVSFGEEGTQ